MVKDDVLVVIMLMTVASFLGYYASVSCRVFCRVTLSVCSLVVMIVAAMMLIS